MGSEGILYVVATPIGNLQDITLRAIDTLKEVDLVVAESTARALKLLSHLGIRKPITNINSYNEERKSEGLAHKIMEGQSVALITGAGTPCISDPGTIFVKKCLDEGIKVCAVPGPSAATGLVSISGLFVDRFLFYGFLPQKKGKRRKILEELAPFPYPVVFYESPRRLEETLRDVFAAFGDRMVVVVKEMTKIYETTYRGNISDVLDMLSDMEKRGEYAFIVDGRAR